MVEARAQGSFRMVPQRDGRNTGAVYHEERNFRGIGQRKDPDRENVREKTEWTGQHHRAKW